MSLNIVTSKVKGKERIADRVYEKIHNFRQDHYGASPTGVVLGPHEYVGLITDLKGTNKYTTREIAYPETFMDINLYVKTTSGIDLLVNSSDVFKYCLHDIQNDQELAALLEPRVLEHGEGDSE